MMCMEIESVKYWQDATKKESRVYVNFVGGASACWYITGNRWNTAKSWTYDRCTAADVAEARKNPLAFDAEARKWQNYSNYGNSTSKNSNTPKRELSYAQKIDRAVRGGDAGEEDARFDIEVEREFNRRQQNFPLMGGD